MNQFTGMYSPKKNQKEVVGEIYGTVLLVVIMTFFALLFTAPMIWVLRHVYSWALGL